MDVILQPGEEILKRGFANLQKNAETVGGELCLTTKRLIFQAHPFNVQRGETQIELSKIQSLEQSWTKLLGFIPLCPNAFLVRLREGREHRFTVWKRGRWIRAVEATPSAACLAL
jgi:hypothetical protein